MQPSSDIKQDQRAKSDKLDPDWRTGGTHAIRKTTNAALRIAQQH
jgi:hypothetical protein